jgi:hypothetical protein
MWQRKLRGCLVLLAEAPWKFYVYVLGSEDDSTYNFLFDILHFESFHN